MAKTLRFTTKKITMFFDLETRQILLLTLTIRLLLIGFVLFFHSLIPFNTAGLQGNYFYHEAGFTLGNLLTAWDGQWFFRLSDIGYPIHPQNINDLAFYVDLPLFPMLVATIHTVTKINLVFIGLIINFLCSLASAVLLYKTIGMLFSKPIAKNAVWLFLINPMSIFFVAFYSEALFLFLTVLALYLAANRHWFSATFIAALSVLTRTLGILTPLLLLDIFFQQRHLQNKSHRPSYLKLISLSLIPLTYLGYTFFVSHLSGIPNTYTAAQHFFGRTNPNLLNILFYSIIAAQKFSSFPLHSVFASQLEIIFILSVTILVISYRRRLPVSYNLYLVALIFLTLSSGTSTAIMRYFSIAIPLYILVAQITFKHPLIKQAVTTGSIMLMSLFTLLYINWYWVG